MIRNHSHYSLLTSISRCNQIVSACKNAGFEFAGLTDIATISGCVNFVQECKKQDMKPIIGSELILENNAKITLICKNYGGWNQLLKVISRCNDADNYDKAAKISLSELKSIIDPQNFVCIDGYVDSALFHNIFKDVQCIFEALDETEMIMSCLHDNYQEVLSDHITSMTSFFPNYYLEVYGEESDSFPVLNIMKNIINAYDVDCKYCIPHTATYYPSYKDSIDHRVLICTKLKTTMKNLPNKINDLKDIDLLKFIRNSNYNIRTINELREIYSNDYMCNLFEIVNSCEEIQILSNPKLPTFETPDGSSENEYLKQLCRDGWKKLISGKVDPSLHEVYKDRVLKELDVIQNAKLSGYFLIVQDYVNYFKDQGCLVGPGRGSGGGSLVCYLTGITLIDPIEYGLLFERFYNEGRNTEDHISLPDIDIDFPPEWRERVIEHLKEKYGESQVCQMLTFGRLAGRSIIKEVLRVNESCSFDQMNKITEKIPNEAAISDLLEEMDNPSVIRWSLENDKDALSDYCWLDDNGDLQGEYAKIFEQAMRMEGIFKTQGKHAAGVVIASHNLEEICPMVKASRSSEKIAGMEMGDLEAIGCVKFDILGVNLLQKISHTVEEINNE